MLTLTEATEEFRLCFNMGNFPLFKNDISNYIIKFNGEKTRANGSDQDKTGHTFVSLGTMFGDLDCHEFRGWYS